MIQLINPQHASAARVTVAVPCVCLSVCYAFSGITYDTVSCQRCQQLYLDKTKKIKKEVSIKMLHHDVTYSMIYYNYVTHSRKRD